MNPELEKLIDLALADGILTEKKKQVLLKKAQEHSMDLDEFEMILEGKMHLRQKELHQTPVVPINAPPPISKQNLDKEFTNKCPNCGETITGLSQVCSSCGYVLNQSTIKGEGAKNLHDALRKLEELIVEVKSFPKPSFGERMKVIFLTYFSLGLYLVYRKFVKKQGDSFETLVAKCDKEKRYIKTYYGEDKKVREAIGDLDTEINSITNERKKLALRTNIGCFGLVIIAIVAYIFLAYWSFHYSKTMMNDLKNQTSTPSANSNNDNGEKEKNISQEPLQETNNSSQLEKTESAVQSDKEKDVSLTVSEQPTSSDKVSTSVPLVNEEQIIKEIKTYSKNKYPNNTSMQDIIYNAQLEAYHFMKQANNEEIKLFVINKYPKDYSMQKIIYDAQVGDKDFMQSAKDGEVKSFVMNKYPKDYSMQKIIYEAQLTDKKYMQSVTNSDAKKEVEERYPNDYSMQKIIYDNKQK